MFGGSNYGGFSFDSPNNHGLFGGSINNLSSIFSTSAFGSTL